MINKNNKNWYLIEEFGLIKYYPWLFTGDNYIKIKRTELLSHESLLPNFKYEGH